MAQIMPPFRRFKHRSVELRKIAILYGMPERDRPQHSQIFTRSIPGASTKRSLPSPGILKMPRMRYKARSCEPIWHFMCLRAGQMFIPG